MTSHKTVSAFGVLALVAFAGLGAFAQCGGVGQHGMIKPQAWIGNSVRSGTMLLTSEREDKANDGEGIVGFWRVTLAAKGNGNNAPPFNPPDGILLDHGFAQWHSDGTEIMNSSRVPSTGSFCLGVWKKVGPSQYVLNHFAISFDDTVHLGYANIREEVTLNDSDSFSGTFSLAIYDGAGNHIATLTGDITGTRVKVSTTLQDIL